MFHLENLLSDLPRDVYPTVLRRHGVSPDGVEVEDTQPRRDVLQTVRAVVTPPRRHLPVQHQFINNY